MFNPLKLQDMLSQAGQMREEVERKLAATVLEGSSGGGAVTAAMNGKKQLLRIHIDPAAVTSLTGDQADREMLQDLIVAAVNDAGRRADEVLQSQLGDQLKHLMGGASIPGLN